MHFLQVHLHPDSTTASEQSISNQFYKRSIFSPQHLLKKTEKKKRHDICLKWRHTEVDGTHFFQFKRSLP